MLIESECGLLCVQNLTNAGGYGTLRYGFTCGSAKVVQDLLASPGASSLVSLNLTHDWIEMFIVDSDDTWWKKYDGGKREWRVAPVPEDVDDLDGLFKSPTLLPTGEGKAYDTSESHNAALMPLKTEEGLLAVWNVYPGIKHLGWKSSYNCDSTVVVNDILKDIGSEKLISLNMTHNNILVYVSDADGEWQKKYLSTGNWYTLLPREQRL